MSQELEEQERVTHELKEKLRSLESDRVSINEQIKILEAKLLVQELRGKIRAAVDENMRLQAKKQELEKKLESQREVLASREHMRVAANQEPPRKFF